ncbi:zinc finger and BTB domain-containing protein 46-like isoform X1 [Arapaima gigas]
MNNRKEDMEITSHYRQLLRELNEQRQHGILCDVCIIVEGKIFKAHKNVLLGSSRYFKTLYCQVKKSTEQQATITHLDIVTAQGFKTILDFMYSAHLALTSKNVIEVMSAASYLQMTDIVQACHNFIKAALDISIRSELADELADFEMGPTAVGGAGGPGAEALASMISGRSSSPWLARRTSPANSSGDSAIASCHEGSSTYGKEDQEPKSHESQEDVSSQPLWPTEFRPIQIKEEQVSPSNFKDGPATSTQTALVEQTNGEAWQPSGSGRRKNRKNKDTVRHITPQAEDDSRACSPAPTVLPVPSWNYGNQEITGTDPVEPNSSDSRSDRLDFFVKQEEALSAEPGFLPQSLAGEKDEHTGQAASVANLRAALMSKNSLLSLRPDMLGEDNPLLFDYLPKGGHSLSRPAFSNSSSIHLGGKFDNKRGAPYSPPPLPLLRPSDRWPSGPSSLHKAGGLPPDRPLMEQQASNPSPAEVKMQHEDVQGLDTGLDGSQPPGEEDQMALEDKSCKDPAELPQELACSLCKRLFGSLDQLREHEYRHTVSLMALSLDCFAMQRPLLVPESPVRYLCSQCPASFTLKSNADRHEKTIHFKRKMMQCAYCLKHFRDRTDLNRHLSSVHSSERVFACPLCAKAFSTQKNLATHAKVCYQAAGVVERLWELLPLKSEAGDQAQAHD